MKLSLFDYTLPRELIAQKPASPRHSSRLLAVNRTTGKIKHDYSKNLGQYLRRGDVLVFNNTKVFPARLIGKKPTGGVLEVFLLRPIKGRTWEVLIGGKVRRVGQEIRFLKKLDCLVTKKLPGGRWQVKFNQAPAGVMRLAKQIGHTPTPPYIKSRATRRQYQTTYAKRLGSVAAPTAGFHFSRVLLQRLCKQGIQLEYITLHVGFGTFQPVTVTNVKKHHMHSEYAEANAQTINRLWQAKKQGRRIIAVGTTSVRTLETACAGTKGKQPAKPQQAFKGWIDTFIYPGYQFQFVDAMITNFHLPKSTLLMLVAAFLQPARSDVPLTYGIKKLKKIYQQAINKKYRFYSFGDAMLIE